MGHELRRRGVTIKGPVGSQERFLGVALANSEQPSIVECAHSAFINAGAQAIITNNYACVPATIGLDVVPHIEAAGRAARRAAGSGALVLGSLPPLKASYRPDLVSPESEMARDYKTIADAIAPFSDVIVCETMSNAAEASSACQAGLATGKPVWVSWALSELADGTLVSGETIEFAVASLPTLEGVEALLFNCSSVEAVEAGLPRLRKCIPERVKIGAYANGFTTVKSLGSDSALGALGEEKKEDFSGLKSNPAKSEYRRDLTPAAYAEIGAGWVKNHGACIVGGCCGIFPEHIAALTERILKEAGVEEMGRGEVPERPSKEARR